MIPRLDAGPCLVQASIPIESLRHDRNDRAPIGGTRCATRSRIHRNATAVGRPVRIGPATGPPAGDASSTIQKGGRSDRLDKNSRRDLQSNSCLSAVAGILYPLETRSGKAANSFDPVGNEPVVQADDLEHETRPGSPGEIAFCEKDRLWVQTGDGLLSIDRVQPAGKRGMSIEEFLRGRQPKTGDSLQ
jgi:hypothetical protein